jgi:hypothetical protein
VNAQRIADWYRRGWTPSRIARDLRVSRDVVRAVLDADAKWLRLDRTLPLGDAFLEMLRGRDQRSRGARDGAGRRGRRLTGGDAPGRAAAEQIVLLLEQVANHLAMNGMTDPLVELQLQRARRLAAFWRGEEWRSVA